ncbi:MAG: ABC transporter ATP-binding protein [Bdellovibrionota bacterium]|nr:MAG: ABC transporter ATP-binding protein [Bdellovibrionota bacterium]
MTLSADSVWKYYDATPALRGVSFSCSESERILIIGANGSGKSTLLRALAGTLSLDRGIVRRPPGTIGYFSPELFLYPALQVRDHLNLWRDAVGSAMCDQSLFQSFGLDRLRYSLVRDLSFGQRVQLALVRTFIRPLDLLVLDEPTTGLDESAVTKLLNHIRQSRSRYQLVASHDLQRFLPWADRVLLLEEGRLIKEGMASDSQSLTDAVERYRISNR